MAFEFVIIDVRDHVGEIVLNRPEKRNALNRGLLSELLRALEKFDEDDNVRCMLISGSGKDFSAGADIGEMAKDDFSDMYIEDRFGAETRAFAARRKPVIAAVSGRALGGGCELAMMCDMIVAAEDAVFGQPEINLGVIAGLGGTQRLTRAIGKSKSMEMHLTGRQMAAKEAEGLGLVSRVVPAGKHLEQARGLADKIARMPPLAVMAVKEAVNRAEELPLSEGLLFERRLFHSLFATEDRVEGMKAFVEKRVPHFRGR